MTQITVTDLTNENKSGVFDKLIESLRLVLREEFTSNRITGSDYSKIVASTVDSVLSQSMQFLLQKDQSAKQVEVMEAQRLLAVTQELVVQKEILLAQANITKLDKEIEILEIQKGVMEASVLLTEAQAAKTEKEVELLDIEKTKTSAEVDLVNASVADTIAKTAMITAQTANVSKEGTLMDKQILKTISETTFLEQRIKTEKAQISDYIDGAPVVGILGRQRVLYQAQSDGFKSKAKQDVMQTLVNTWITRRSTDENEDANLTNKLNDTYLGAAVAACMVDADITLP
jgi:hypothetical protein